MDGYTACMELNYHHLMYFWLAAREGSVTRAAEKLLLAQPTVSGQIRTLEETIGEKLFTRRGRHLVLTERGQLVFSFADRIFTVGQELVDVLQDHPQSGPLLVRVGIANALPKTVAAALIEPALQLDEDVHVLCHEDKAERLLAELSLDAYDIVLSDSPIGPAGRERAFNHYLGDSKVALFGVAALATKYRKGFPESLADAPMLLPTTNTAIRRSIDAWFEKHDIQPRIVAEFEDKAMLKAFGQRGTGLFPAPVVVRRDIIRQYRVKVVAEMDGVTEQFYAISIHRKLKNAAAAAICDNASERLSNLSATS